LPGWLVVEGARHNNLKDITVEIPLGRFTCVTGVSGSGKSSLVNDIIREELARRLNGATNTRPGAHRRIVGDRHLDKVIDIDQSPIGRTPRSNPATYIKVFDEIRSLFAKLPDSRVRGYASGRFSFNVATGSAGGGRCEACEGNGANRIAMDFLADVWVTCAVCGGRRFNRETLQIHYKGRSIQDVLEMDVQEALRHFESIPRLRHMLATLHDVGLDYIKLGQSSTTLSGGEAQRIKLARELVKRSTGRTLYMLDEPTTGLHFEDIRRLLAVLHGFVDAGNTVLVVEHNLDVIKTADWVIDLGPEGGDGGGRVVAAGTPEDVARCRQSFTGRVLREVLAPPVARSGSRGVGDGRKKRRAGRMATPEAGPLVVVGAKQHNLKDITVEVPRGAMTVCSGVSGSGKTSFAIDTVYAEGQRRYVESLSAYARQFLGQLDKPKVDHIHGLAPSIAIEQQPPSKSPRSTVGTVTEIYDYMRVLWARVGRPHCPRCDRPIGTQTSDEIVERIMSSASGTRLLLCAPVEPAPGEKWDAIFERSRSQGYVRARIDGGVRELAEGIRIDERRDHQVELVVDRVVIRAESRSRIADSIEHGLALGNGVLVVVSADAEKTTGATRYSQLLACDSCGRSFEELTPHQFSFNSRLGWCPTCEGLGVQRGTSEAAVFRDANRSLLDGAVSGWERAASNPMLRAMVVGVASSIGIDPAAAVTNWTAKQRREFLWGTGERWIEVEPVDGTRGVRVQWRGFFPTIDDAARISWQYRTKLQDLVTDIPCRACAGGRIRPESEAVRLGGHRIGEVCGVPLSEASAFFHSLRFSTRDARIAGELLHEIKARLQFLLDVGLGYLSLSRSAPTLSGGESQRIRLASQIGSGLTGVLYVLDEPTIGLHPRDNARLIAALHKLRGLGNTLLMVEHDREVIASSDHVIDFGPSAGAGGGHVVAAGSPRALRKMKGSLTGAYLAGTSAIPVPTHRRAAENPGAGERVLTLVGCTQNNLKNIDVALPLGRFICITGVSGSGKSSLVCDILHPALASRLHRARLSPGAHGDIRGMEHVDKVINVDQQPIGNSPLSNPATYSGVFDLVREVFARLPDSKIRGYTANRFSFNRPGGRCDDCDGLGQICHEMHFLPDVWVTCETCRGTRYQRETLEVLYKGKCIADVLSMSVSEALAHFENVPKIRRPLQTLDDVGLGYVPLGQSAPTLSGGEAQRLKLGAELARPSTGKTVYLLDEPTTGLHFDDLRKLLDVLHRFVDMGNTVICVEHNLDVIKTADWVIDLGPEAGDAGGTIVSEGTPETVAQAAGSHTGRVLGEVLATGPHAARQVFDAKKAAAEAMAVHRAPLFKSQDRVKLPWERDGRRWHTSGRRSREGKPVEWEGAALAFIIDRIERLGRDELCPTDWYDRARVEVTAAAPAGLAQAAVPWFCHALTGGRWLLDLLFRVPAGTFDGRALERKLNLKTLDDRDDIEAYGQSARVRILARQRPWEMVRILVHDRKEIDTKAFRSFLSAALSAYLKRIEGMAGDESKAAPWKRDGRSWHLSQKSIPPNQDKKWRPVELASFIGRAQKSLPDIQVDWSGKVFVELKRGDDRRVAKIITHQGAALRVDVCVPPGRFTPTQVEHVGIQQQFARPGSSDAGLSFWFQSNDQIHGEQLKAVLRAASGLEAVTAR
jgi:excinuclease ABC subunit A